MKLENTIQKQRKNKSKINYPQPHNIKVDISNCALREHTILYIHRRLKYQAKYQKSKASKRLYR